MLTNRGQTLSKGFNYRPLVNVCPLSLREEIFNLNSIAIFTISQP